MIKTNLKTDFIFVAVNDFFSKLNAWQTVLFWCVAVFAIAIIITLVVCLIVSIKRKKNSQQFDKQFVIKLPDVSQTNATDADSIVAEKSSNVGELSTDDGVLNTEENSKKLDLIIEQFELDESISKLSAQFEKSNADDLAKAEPNLQQQVSLGGELSQDKIQSCRNDIMLLRAEIGTIINDETCALVKQKFYDYFINLTENEKSNKEISNLILKSICNCNHAAELARYRRMLKQSAARVNSQRPPARQGARQSKTPNSATSRVQRKPQGERATGAPRDRQRLQAREYDDRQPIRPTPKKY